jgi:hypothetical protein
MMIDIAQELHSHVGGKRGKLSWFGVVVEVVCGLAESGQFMPEASVKLAPEAQLSLLSASEGRAFSHLLTPSYRTQKCY